MSEGETLFFILGVALCAAWLTDLLLNGPDKR
jgi:hypothetical protein